MNSIDFNGLENEPIVGQFIKTDISNIHTLIKNNAEDSLSSALNNLRSKLISHFNKAIISLDNHSVNDSAKWYFSQCLQYFFYSIFKMEITLESRKQIADIILKIYKNDFFYTLSFNAKEKVVFWIDKITKDSALTVVTQYGDHETFKKLLDILKLQFEPKNSANVVASELENYLFHENALGRSALTLIWLRGEQTMEAILFAFATLYYKQLHSQTFEKFLFQIDSQANTALMRVAEKKLLRLFPLIINNIERIFNGKQSNGFQKLLLHENAQGETVLHKLLQQQHVSQLNFLLKEIENAFSNIKIFFQLGRPAKKIALIEAVKTRNRKLLALLINFFTKHSISLNELFQQQDSKGYTVLMASVEINYLDGFNYLINKLINYNWGMEYDYEDIVSIFRLRTHALESSQPRTSASATYNVFQIAAKTTHWEILETLLDTVNLASNGKIRLTRAEINYIDENGVDVLTMLYREERNARKLQTGLRMSTREKTERQRRLKLARIFAQLGHRSQEKLVSSWAWIENQGLIERVINFFSIFCDYSNPRSKRALKENCFFSEENYRVSFPEKLTQRYPEALINIVAILKQTNLDSIEQISIIRNKQKASIREKQLEKKFSEIIQGYYDRHSPTILTHIKTNTVQTLETAFSSNKPYILLDNHADLLLLGKNKLFSGALLNSVKFLYLDPATDTNVLQLWLDSYFGTTYTIHPFDPEFLISYPEVLVELQQPILSDSAVLVLVDQHIKREVLRELFLLDGKAIEIDKLAEKNFFITFQSRLSFRAERFHEIFFKLNSTERNFLKALLATHTIPIANYLEISSAENIYLSAYGMELMKIMRTPEEITSINLFDAAINAHEKSLSNEIDLSDVQKRDILSEFRALKTKLTNTESNVNKKAALQLLILLTPSGIQGIAKKDPLELAAPLGLIAADAALQEILTNLVAHPQAGQIFAGELAEKVLGITRQTVERVPIIGSTLVLYGLIQSGKTLMKTASHDPNRPYYAHLFANNLITAAVMGAETLGFLPFWPAFILFGLLTVDQIVTKGQHVHDSLHLQDDYGHTLLRFYTKLELGLSIVNTNIKGVLQQRQLFNNFLNYLAQVNNVQGDAALVTVFLPTIYRGSVPAGVDTVDINGCPSQVVGADTSFYEPSPACMTDYMRIEEKGDYSYELGKLKTFCELRDSFTTEFPSNYTLLVGDQSSDCSLGQTKTINAAALGNLKNVAGILVNTLLRQSNTSNDYPLFLPIDPDFIRNYDVKLLPNDNNETPSGSNIKEWLPCENDTVQCIKNIRVLVSSLYTNIVSDSTLQTKIAINDNAIRSNGINTGVKAIEYSLSITNNVYIAPNQIPEKKFSFFNNNHSLIFIDNNSIKSDNNFEALLSDTKKLILDFTDKSHIQGAYRAPKHQMLLINQLRGKSENEPAVLDVTQSPNFTIGLAEFTQLRSIKIEISLPNKFKTAILDVYRHFTSSSDFYHFLLPLNKIKVVYPPAKEKLFLYYLAPEEETMLAVRIKNSAANYTEPLRFVGRYEQNNITNYARIVMHRKENSSWECNLEITLNNTNTTKPFDLNTLALQNFTKVSIIESNNHSYKKINYLFYQSINLPVIHGKFITYRLVGTEDGWLIRLTHAAKHEETACFISMNTKEIIIDHIRYEMSTGLATLLAIGTSDNSPINGDNLIAPIKINKCACLCAIENLPNAIYKIDNIYFTNLSLGTKLWFTDEIIPFSYIQYHLQRNDTGSLTNNTMHLLDGRQFLATQPVVTRLVKKRSLVPTVTPSPRLEESKVSTLLKKNNETGVYSQNTFLSFTLFKELGKLKPILSNTHSKNVYTPVDYTNDVNAQLVLARYVLHYLVKKPSKKLLKPYKKKKLTETLNMKYSPEISTQHESYSKIIASDALNSPVIAQLGA